MNSMFSRPMAVTRQAASGYFEHHGLLAPGVRLMRALSIKGKAVLLALCFLLPLLLLAEQHAADLWAHHIATANDPLGAQRDALRALQWFGAEALAWLALTAYVVHAFQNVMGGGLLQLKRQVGLMAGGDLSLRPTPRGRDEVAAAMHSLGQSLARLADLFSEVRLGVAAASHASTEIAGGNQALAQRTASAAQVIEQILGVVGRYVDQLEACGGHVEQAESVVQHMRLDAERARHQMGQLNERMTALQRRSREIGEIVELIDNLSFRTNILALNASIEAAKAGEAGRGFAVVAQEVRSLAQRSTESARRISDIVGRSAEDMAHGHALAGEAVQALRATDAQVGRIHGEMRQIVALTRTGQADSQLILGELRRLGAMTDDNARLVDQMAAASTALSDQGLRLSGQVDSFKLS